MVQSADNPVESFKKLLYNHSLQIDFLVEKLESNQYLAHIGVVIELLCASLKNHGKIVLVGCGKSFKIAKKTVAMLQSLGLPSMYLHPTEALHGDIGCLKKQDSLLVCSTSGETDEIISFLNYLKKMESLSEDMGADSVNKIAVCAKAESSVSQLCDTVMLVPQKFMEDEIQDGLKAPTISTTSMLIVLDCLCIAVSNAYYDNDLTKRNECFSKAHPAGGIGKRANSLPKYEMTTSSETPLPLWPASIGKIRPTMNELELLQTLVLHDWVIIEHTLQLPSKAVQIHYKNWTKQNDTTGASFCNYLKMQFETQSKHSTRIRNDGD